ncbi:unnamed protein product [Sphenostylis stenocarpa]|uniref:Uncharacterized protein n=1 Tax=Sphenostylis stenocarpa TaxID=92480 RepID=A0AA86S966_9FABA|nr:unnamed protein product [Sphenostylis stenocarpa]
MVGMNSMETFRREMEKEEIRWEVEKEDIRREIMISEMRLARRKELEEEVRKEMAEGVVGISIQRPPRITFPEPISMPFNPTLSQVSHDNLITHHLKTNDNDKVTILAKSDGGSLGPKRKALTLPIIDGNEDGPKKE